MAIVAVSMFLTSCADRTVSVPATSTQTNEVEVNVLYEPGDQFTPEHHSKNQVTGKNCAGKTITYSRYEDNGAGCPETAIGKAHYFMKTPVVENQNQQVVVTNYWSGFDANSIWPWVIIIGLILLGMWAWNNRNGNHNHNHNHTHEHHYPVNSNPNARSDFHNRPGCHQNNDNARNGWFNGSIPDAYPNIEEETINLSVTRRYPQTGTPRTEQPASGRN